MEGRPWGEVMMAPSGVRTRRGRMPPHIEHERRVQLIRFYRLRRERHEREERGRERGVVQSTTN